MNIVQQQIRIYITRNKAKKHQIWGLFERELGIMLVGGSMVHQPYVWFQT